MKNLDKQQLIAKIKGLKVFQEGESFTIDDCVNRLHAPTDKNTYTRIAHILREMHDEGGLVEGIKVVGNARYRTYRRARMGADVFKMRDESVYEMIEEEIGRAFG